MHTRRKSGRRNGSAGGNAFEGIHRQLQIAPAGGINPRQIFILGRSKKRCGRFGSCSP